MPPLAYPDRNKPMTADEALRLLADVRDTHTPSSHHCYTCKWAFTGFDEEPCATCTFADSVASNWESDK